mmetsp:Transcript_3228/g.6898  ORF Transcript_3228/g.6898 Transcript_3228/m.6898 type:complete len:488 (+) Transcript_3228:69-1532(+)
MNITSPTHLSGDFFFSLFQLIMLLPSSSTTSSTAPNNEHRPLLSPPPSLTGGEHLEIDRTGSFTSTSHNQQHRQTPAHLAMKINEEGVGKTTADPENDIVQNICSDDDEEKSSTNRNPKGASLFQTALNIAKLCMGTGTLALPFASQKGGLVFNVVGLGLIGLWNYYSACCLLRCLELLPVELRDADSCDRSGNNCEGVAKCVQIDDGSERKNIDSYGALDRNDENNSDIEKTHAPNQKLKKQPIICPPPEGTTAYGTVAWYASGPKGLLVLDLLMLLLFVGLLIAYEVAMMSFITDMPITTGSNKVDLLIPSVIVSLLSCAPDISFLSNFSALGLLALALSFTVIAWQGVDDNGLYGFYHMDELNLFPKNWTDASSWFGVVAFGYGIVPVIFNIRDSMAQPEYVQPSTKIGLIMVFVGYITISNGVRILFSPAHVFDGDVLQAMPDTWISFIVRLLMTFVVRFSTMNCVGFRPGCSELNHVLRSAY